MTFRPVVRFAILFVAAIPFGGARCVGYPPSDPFLAAEFDRKTLHLRHDSGEEVTFTIEVDFPGDRSWAVHSRVPVPPGGYEPFVFPEGYAAERVRVTADTDCRSTAHFIYR